jgi:ferrochelatase
MNTFTPPPLTAVILCNLGTPNAPTPAAVRRYLAEFLSDPRVVEIPRPIWLPILYGIILTIRPKKSAAKYQQVWLDSDKGSPLLHYTKLQTAGLQARLGHQAKVYTAMRYGQPALPTVLSQAQAAGAQRIVILPMYPQYSGTTTASVYDSASAWSAKQRNIPSLSIVSDFHQHPAYIAALAAQVQAHWQQHGRAEKLLLSFHGVPQRTVDLGDPYAAQCQQTAQLLATALQLQPQQWQISFQSRFGKAKWLEPATDHSLEKLATQGCSSVDVFCPGFVADCLETLEEIAMENREVFMHAGGQDFRFIPCLNDSPAWLDALAQVLENEI